MNSPDSPNDSQQTASTLLFCRMCQAVYKEPKLLPCLHSFCRPCLEDAVTHGAEGSSIICPLCSHETRLPRSGVEGVPDNCFLSRMCQEYVAEVQKSIVARSLYPAASPGASTLPALTRRPSIEASPKFTPMQSPRSQPPSGHTDRDTPDTPHTDHSPELAQTSTATAIEAIRNMNRLQTKILSLQGEALRVTYAIDLVNQYASDWHQHKEDFKMAIQRRAAQFQFFIQRMEHQLKTQIDSKSVDDNFYSESMKGKTELRKNLNNILHEVNVLKSIQEHGNDAEINALSSSLLGKSISLSDVLFKKMQFDLATPTKTIEEIVESYFGEVKLDSEESSVYSPEILDFNEVSVGNVAEPVETGNYFRFDDRRHTIIEENRELDNAALASAKRRSVDRKSRRYNTDLGLNRQDVKDYLVQFQDARETFRTRRLEILAQGQKAREDVSPQRDEPQRQPRSTSRKEESRRVQSLDRVALPVTTRGRTLAKNSLEAPEIRATRTVQHGVMSPGGQEDISYSQPDGSLNVHYGDATSQFMSIPSPIPEDLHSPTSPQRKLVKQISDPRFFHGMPQSPEEESSVATAHPSQSQSLIEKLRERRSASSSLLSGRRHSDQFSPLSPEEHTTLDLLKQDRTTGRPVRRAITNVADRKAKIEFLRENWQKRKEILIQNEGFVSGDVVKQATRPPEQAKPHLKEDILSNVQTPDSVEAVTCTSPSDDSSDDPRHESMHQIRSRVAQYRHELNKRDEPHEKEAKTNLSSYSGINVSEMSSDNLRAPKDTTSPDLGYAETNRDQRLSEETTDDVVITITEVYGPPTTADKAYGTPTTTETVYGTPTSTEKVYGTPSATENVYGTPTTTQKVYGTPTSTEKVYGTPSTTEKVYGTPTTTQKVYGTPTTTEKVYGTPTTTEKVYGTPTTTEKVYGTPSTTDKVYGTPSTADKVYGTPTTADKVYGTPTTADKVYGTPTTAETVYGTPTSTDKVYGTPSTAEKVYGTAAAAVHAPTRYTADHNLSETSSMETVFGTNASNTLSRPTSDHSVSRPTAAERVYRPTPAERVSRPTPAETVSRPTPDDTASRPTAAERVYRTTIPETVSEPTAVENVPRTAAAQKITETPIPKEIPAPTTIPASMQPQPTIQTSADQTEASTPSPIPATRSRYSRYQTRKTENIDVASLIAAMYSGNEKTLLHTTSPSSDASNQPRVTAPATNSSGAAENSSVTESKRTADSSRATETSRIADSNSVTSISRAAETSRIADSNSVTSISRASESRRAAESSTGTYNFNIAGSKRDTESVRTAGRYVDAENPIEDAASKRTAERNTAAESIKHAEQIRTARIDRADENIPDTGRIRDAETSRATENVKDLNSVRFTATALTSPSAFPRRSYSQTAETSRETVFPNTHDQSKVAPEDEHAAQQGFSSSISSSEAAQQIQPRQPRQGMRSKFTDGVNRRHTIEVGREAIESARQMMARGETASMYQAPLPPISESPTPLHTTAYTPYYSRFSASSSQLTNLESTNGNSPTTPPPRIQLDTDDTTDSPSGYRTRTPKLIPSPLQVIQEKPLFDHPTSPQPTSARSLSPRTPPSPLSLSQDVIDQKLKLREIARKKKERWRYLTIH